MCHGKTRIWTIDQLLISIHGLLVGTNLHQAIAQQCQVGIINQAIAIGPGQQLSQLLLLEYRDGNDGGPGNRGFRPPWDRVSGNGAV